jgi:hypothetical protein
MDALHKLHDPEFVCMPGWFGREEFHRSHQSNLKRKDPLFYGRLFDVPSDLDYWWPTHHGY